MTSGADSAGDSRPPAAGRASAGRASAGRAPASRTATRTPRALSIAGSDSGGGAGVQADLKAFARCGVHGMTAITAITAQSTVGVRAIHPLPRSIVLEQVRAVLHDIGVDAVKVGMLGTREAALAVADALDMLPAGTPVVVDPVMIAESGAALGDDDAIGALIEHVLPRATVTTPNLPEAHVLAAAARARDGGSRGGDEGSRGRDEGDGGCAEAPDGDARERDENQRLLEAILRLGPRAVLVTGGHRQHAVDLLLRAGAREPLVEIPGPRHPGDAAHGSGCTHSSALAAGLARGYDLHEAARFARTVAAEAVRDGLRDVGDGPGPVDALGIARRR